MCAHEKRPSHVRKTWYLFFYTGFRAATNIIKKCFLPFRLRILHLALEAADSIGQLSSLLRYPTFLLFPVLRRFLRLVSTSFNLLPLSNLKPQSKFSRATFWRANNWPAAVGEPPCFDSFLLQGLSLSKWTASKAAIRSNLWNGVF